MDGDEDNNDANDAGAVYVFTRDGVQEWSQQAYLKAFNTEDSAAIGVDGDEGNGAADSGAVYVFTRTGARWSPAGVPESLQCRP